MQNFRRVWIHLNSGLSFGYSFTKKAVMYRYLKLSYAEIIRKLIFVIEYTERTLDGMNLSSLRVINILMLVFIGVSGYSQEVGRGLYYFAEGEEVFDEYHVKVDGESNQVIVMEGDQLYDYDINLITRGKGSRKKNRIFYAVTLDQEHYVIMIKKEEEFHHVVVRDFEGVVMREYGYWRQGY